ncbi:MAG: hypothetical protein JO280_10000 [Mycobacteriaceae bacterium]|nr:hypothetical protein [Mycobacteriaceae bacterium]
MTATLPFPITFDLPPGWSLVDPDEMGETDAAYVAVRERNRDDGFPTNLLISGLGVHGAVDITALASRHAEDLGQKYPTTVVRRDDLSQGTTREVAQLLEVQYPHENSTVALKQTQIITAYSDQHDPPSFAVLQVVMTCPETVFDDAAPEFATFLTTIKSQQPPGPDEPTEPR